jgi:hypothetical protein
MNENVRSVLCGSATQRLRVNEIVAHNLALAAELIALDESFQDAGIRLAAWKGPLQSQLLHGHFTQRRFHDLDLLLRPSDLDKATALLGSLGYKSGLSLTPAQQRAFLRDHHEQAFVRDPDYVVELHWQIVQRQFAVDYPLDGILVRLQRVSFYGRELLHPGPEDTLVLTAVHAAKHAWLHADLLNDLGRAVALVQDWALVSHLAESAHVQRYLSCGLLLSELLGYVQLPEHIKQRALRDPVAVTLAARLRANKASAMSTIRGRERWSDRARMIVRTAMTPTINDWSAQKISDRWFFLYYFTRQGRLLRRVVSSVARTA